MTTTDTMDTDSTVDQSIKMIKAGSEYVRITAPNARQAQNLQNIKDELNKKGYAAPLVADIHFTPNAAEIAAQIVEKVRINPDHKIIKKLIKIGKGKIFSDSIKLLYEQALIIEGLKPDNPSDFVKRLNEVLNKSL